MNAKLEHLLKNVANIRGITLEDLKESIDEHELSARERVFPILSTLILTEEIDINAIKNIADDLPVFSWRDCDNFKAFLNDQGFAQDAIQSLIKDFPRDDEAASMRIDAFIEKLVNYDLSDESVVFSEADAGLFCSILLTAAFPERFVDFRQGRWKKMAKMLGYELPAPGSSYGQMIVWAGKFAQVVAKTPVVQRYWQTKNPLWVVAGLCWNLKGEANDKTISNEDEMTDLEYDDRIPALLDKKKQIILYGSPGTGKTYNSVIRAHEIIFGEHDPSITYRSLKEKLQNQQKSEFDLSQLTWLEAIMLVFHESNRDKIQVDDIKKSKIIQAFSSYKNNHFVSNTIWNILLRESRLDSETVKVKNKTGREYFDKDSESNWFLTEKGKEFQKRLIEDLTESPESHDSQFSFITFHQSFSYEDFVEGIRPEVENEDESGISYRIKDGIFKEMCKKAALDPENNYVLIIDEINRGNISKIFGELITLLEENKRTGEKEEITVRLPYSGESFSVPNNVYVIGTMNSTDKSIALVDTALRRRFYFERLDVDYDLIPNQDAKKFLIELNSIICAIKNPDYEIGHYYFMNIPENDHEHQNLKKVFSNQILPLLEEYFFNDWEALATILGHDSIKIEKRKKLVWNEDSGTFEKDTGDYDQIFGRSIKSADIVFENTLKNLGIIRVDQENLS